MKFALSILLALSFFSPAVATKGIYCRLLCFRKCRQLFWCRRPFYSCCPGVSTDPDICAFVNPCDQESEVCKDIEGGGITCECKLGYEGIPTSVGGNGCFLDGCTPAMLLPDFEAGQFCINPANLSSSEHQVEAEKYGGNLSPVPNDSTLTFLKTLILSAFEPDAVFLFLRVGGDAAPTLEGTWKWRLLDTPFWEGHPFDGTAQCGSSSIFNETLLFDSLLPEYVAALETAPYYEFDADSVVGLEDRIYAGVGPCLVFNYYLGFLSLNCTPHMGGFFGFYWLPDDTVPPMNWACGSL